MPSSPAVAAISVPRLRLWQRRITTGAVVLNAALWLYLAFKVRPSPEPMTLHYTIYFGIDRVGEWYRTYVLPFAGLAIAGVNYYITIVYRSREPLIGNLLAVTSLVAQLLLWISALTLVS